MEPLVRMLVSNGVTYPTFAQSLKRIFLDAAEAELLDEGRKVTDSSLSLLSGVHRKDVRSLAAQASDLESRRVFSLASEVATRWLSDPLFNDDEGRPRILPIRTRETNEQSFELLAQSVSKDYHARSVLDELLRLGIAEVVGAEVRLVWQTFTPRSGYAETAHYLGQNVRDHVAAFAANLRNVGQGRSPEFLEYAILATEITQDSSAELKKLGDKLASAAFKSFAAAATGHSDQDASASGSARDQRVRFGIYCYSEKMTAPSGTDSVRAADAAVPAGGASE